MASLKTLLTIPLALLVLTIPSSLAANPEQTGTGGDCVNDIATFFQGQGVPPASSEVVVAPGTTYAISGSSDTVYVDFFDADSLWVGWNGGAAGGVVPSSAAYGVVCPATLTDPVLGAPIVPDPTGTWTYQDGL